MDSHNLHEDIDIFNDKFIPSLYCNFDHSLFLDAKGDLYFSGKFKKFNITTNSTVSPLRIPIFSNIKMVSGCIDNIVCLDFNGTVFEYDSTCQKIDISNNTSLYSPIKLNLSSIIHICCGESFSVYLSVNGDVYTKGSNEFGQLGIFTTCSDIPVLIPNIKNIELIECGFNHVISKSFMQENYVWGNGSKGQLGYGSSISFSLPTLMNNWPENICSISCGAYHSILLTSSGDVYGFGDNEIGQLGLGNKNNIIYFPTLIEGIPEVSRVECGYRHTICIDIDKRLWVFGNNYGQLGLGDITNRYTPTLNESLHDIIDISSGRGEHIFVKTITNEIYAFGNNEYSQLGIQTSDDNQTTPIRVLEGLEDIWKTHISKSRCKSARN